MNPETAQEIAELKQRLARAESFMRSFLSAAELSPDIQRTLKQVVGAVKLSDLEDVSGTDSASTGQVLKKTATTWQPGTDIDT